MLLLQRGALLEVFWYLRQYPTKRAMRLTLLHREKKDTAAVLKRIKKRLHFLATSMTDVSEAAALRFVILKMPYHMCFLHM